MPLRLRQESHKRIARQAKDKMRRDETTRLRHNNIRTDQAIHDNATQEETRTRLIQDKYKTQKTRSDNATQEETRTKLRRDKYQTRTTRRRQDEDKTKDEARLRLRWEQKNNTRLDKDKTTYSFNIAPNTTSCSIVDIRSFRKYLSG